jgi:uncharacterized protein YndB with AHSA1/START domain
MASARASVTIGRPPDDVWKVVRDASAISTWFPGITESTADGKRRTCVLDGGAVIEEEIVNCDDELRRFQYRILSGMPVDQHLGTVDVHDLEDGRSLVVYSTEVLPDTFGAPIAESMAAGLASLRNQMEQT